MRARALNRFLDRAVRQGKHLAVGTATDVTQFDEELVLTTFEEIDERLGKLPNLVEVRVLQNVLSKMSRQLRTRNRNHISKEYERSKLRRFAIQETP